MLYRQDNTGIICLYALRAACNYFGLTLSEMDYLVETGSKRISVIPLAAITSFIAYSSLISYTGSLNRGSFNGKTINLEKLS
jgi:hypothetical protein